jgi:hypothetical protein
MDRCHLAQWFAIHAHPTLGTKMIVAKLNVSHVDSNALGLPPSVAVHSMQRSRTVLPPLLQSKVRKQLGMRNGKITAIYFAANEATTGWRWLRTNPNVFGGHLITCWVEADYQLILLSRLKASVVTLIKKWQLSRPLLLAQLNLTTLH